MGRGTPQDPAILRRYIRRYNVTGHELVPLTAAAAATAASKVLSAFAAAAQSAQKAVSNTAKTTVNQNTYYVSKYQEKPYMWTALRIIRVHQSTAALRPFSDTYTADDYETLLRHLRCRTSDQA